MLRYTINESDRRDRSNLSIRQGLRLAIADVNEAQLKEAGAEVAALVSESNVLVIPTDVSKLEDVVHLKDTVLDAWGEVSTAPCGPAYFLYK